MLTLSLKNRLTRIFLWFTFALGIWLMVTGAARTSFVAVIVSVFITILVRSFKEKNLTKKIKFFLSKSIVTGSLILIIFSGFGDDIRERLFQSLNSYPLFSQNYIKLSNGIVAGKEFIMMRLDDSNAPDIKIEKPENGLSVDEAAILVASDIRPTPLKPNDVFVDVPDEIRIATVSATGKMTTIIIEAPRTYSDNALKYGLSFAIRLDTLWPQALSAFYKNPALGTGYATLTKSEVNEFTEADSTDNNFLRTLGEIGLLGFITFYGAIVLAIIQAYKIAFKKNLNIYEKTLDLKTLLATAFIGSTIGLLINATFIDVFAASKVALTFWSITGILFALENIKDLKKKPVVIKKIRTKVKQGKFKNTAK